MARSLGSLGVEVDVATTDDDGPGRRFEGLTQGQAMPGDGFSTRYFSKQTELYKVSIPLLTWLLRNVSCYDLVHIHAVFSFASLAAGWAAHRRGVPYIVRPLGVLNSWGMRNRRRLLKKWSFRLLDKPVLDRAAAIHYTSTQEQMEAAALDIRAPAKVIPLGFELPQRSPDAALARTFEQAFPQTAGRPLVLFLSRLDPKKNIETLLRAMAAVDPAVLLVIAGTGAPEYAGSLRQLAEAAGVARRVIWTGHLEGELKAAAFAAASVFVLPSMSENFGIALLEAMAAALPCISSPGVALAAEAARDGAVQLVEPSDVPALAAAITELVQDEAARRELGARAQTCAAAYSSEAVGEKLLGLYQQCVSHAPV
jgi:glycosyltransferase involved in cell wall biosynthesis